MHTSFEAQPGSAGIKSPVDPASSERVVAEIAEMHHRFSNVLQSVRAVLRKHANAVTDADSRDAFLEADSQLHAFGLLHERLRCPGSDNDGVATCCASYLREVCLDLETAALKPRGIQLICVVTGPVPLPEATCRYLALLLTELVLNAAKHAFIGRAEGNVAIRFGPSSPERLQLAVADDGIGLPPEGSSRQGGGTQLIRMLTASLHASCVIATGPRGTSYTFELPGPQAH